MLIAIIALAAAEAARPAPREIIEKMQNVYERTQDFRAEFRQTLTYRVYGRKQTFDGIVQLKKPGKMRWDYTRPDKKLFVSDGKVLWVYEPEDNQAFRQTLGDSALPTAVTFLLGQGKLDKEFDVSRVTEGAAEYGDAADYVLKLVPKLPNAQYKHLILDVDPKTFQVKQTFIFDTQGNVNQVSFFKPELNTRVKDALFQFTPPAGTKVVTPGQLRRP